jgi:hypothetical protein
MADSPQDALLFGIVSVGLVAFTLAGLCRMLRLGVAWTGSIIPAAFLAAYVVAYNKVPTFPPIGAANKVFYVALAGALVGLAADLAGRPRLAALLLLIQPLAAALYIGQSRLAEAPLEILVAGATGVAVMILLQRKMGGATAEDGMKRGLLLAIASLGFAPIALLGASSTSLQLCLIFAVAVLATLPWSFGKEDDPFGTSAVLGGAGGIISVVYAVTLITRKSDLLALATLGLIFFVPDVSRRMPWLAGLQGRFTRLLGFALLCAIPTACAVTIAIFSYGSSFPI